MQTTHRVIKLENDRRIVKTGEENLKKIFLQRCVWSGIHRGCSVRRNDSEKVGTVMAQEFTVQKRWQWENSLPQVTDSGHWHVWSNVVKGAGVRPGHPVCNTAETGIRDQAGAWQWWRDVDWKQIHFLRAYSEGSWLALANVESVRVREAWLGPRDLCPTAALSVSKKVSPQKNTPGQFRKWNDLSHKKN